MSVSQTAYLNGTAITNLHLCLKGIVKWWVGSDVFQGAFGPSGLQVTLLSDRAILPITHHCLHSSGGRDTKGLKGVRAEDSPH